MTETSWRCEEPGRTGKVHGPRREGTEVDRGIISGTERLERGDRRLESLG